MVTGGTCGIGLAAGKLIIAEGVYVAVTGRNDVVFANAGWAYLEVKMAN